MRPRTPKFSLRTWCARVFGLERVVGRAEQVDPLALGGELGQQPPADQGLVARDRAGLEDLDQFRR